MASPNRSPYRIYLVLEPLREVLPRLSELLKPLAEVAPSLPGVEGFYDNKNDVALFGLKFQRSAVERIGPNLLISLVGECGLPVIAPEELSEEQYVAFFARHLPAYPVQIRHFTGNDLQTSLIEQLIDSLNDSVASARADEMRFAEGTGTDYHSIEISHELPSARLRKQRPESNWELVLDDDDELPSNRNRPETEWELVL